MTTSSKTRTRRLDSDGGFTLIEVMVAIVILTVGLLSLAQMMVLATNSNTLSGRMTSSSALAKEQLERLKATPFYSNPVARTRSAALVDGGFTQRSRRRIRCLLRSGRAPHGCRHRHVRSAVAGTDRAHGAPAGDGAHSSALSAGIGRPGSIRHHRRSEFHHVPHRERRVSASRSPEIRNEREPRG